MEWSRTLRGYLPVRERTIDEAPHVLTDGIELLARMMNEEADARHGVYCRQLQSGALTSRVSLSRLCNAHEREVTDFCLGNPKHAHYAH